MADRKKPSPKAKLISQLKLLSAVSAQPKCWFQQILAQKKIQACLEYFAKIVYREHKLKKIRSVIKKQLMKGSYLVSYKFCGGFAPGQLLPYPKEAINDPLPKHLLLCTTMQCYQVFNGSCS